MRPSRPIYRVPVATWPPLDADGLPAPDGNSAEITRSGDFVYLRSAIDPNPAIVAGGGEWYADDFVDVRRRIPTAARDVLFRARIEVQEDGEPVTRGVRRREIPDSPSNPTVPVLEDWRIPVCFHWAEGEAEQAEVDAVEPDA